MRTKYTIIFALLVMFLAATAASPVMAKDAKTIVFTDLSWDSAMVHNRIAAFIIEKGMGYKAEFVPGATAVMVTGVAKGDIDVDMESWTENLLEIYNKFTKSGKIIDLGSNFSDSWQGWLVPTYMIKGDPKRGIKAIAPDLKTVADMAKYWKAFKDPEDPTKGRFYNSIPGWKVTGLNSKKLKGYGLDKYYTDFMPGSDASLAGSIAAAYKKGKPWFGYYWSPTWVLGKYDMTMLEEPPFSQDVWDKTNACAFQPTQVNILVNHELPKRAPDVVAMLKNYETTAEINNKFLAHMRETKGKPKDGAIFFLKNYESLWTKWVSAEVAAKVKAALK